MKCLTYIPVTYRKLSRPSINILLGLLAKNLSQLTPKNVNWKEFAGRLKHIEKNRSAAILQPFSEYPIRSQARRNEKKYVLSMFPYPSGNLHMGHVRVYANADAMARFYHLKGYNVVHPMGWDAFGLPAENAAIERGENPADWTNKNISNMKKQLNSFGCCFDWSQELRTCDPDYYKWTQLLFLKIFKAELAYRKEAVVNWDPVDRTVLANEQVSDKGISWRSGAKVEKKLLKQWFIKTTRYSEDLYDDLQELPQESWHTVSAIQKHWIGECSGYNIEFKLYNIDKNSDCFDMLPVWISNPERLINVSFLGLSSGHFLDQEKFVDYTKDNIKVLNLCGVEPITRNRIPIIVSDELQFEPDCQVYTGIPLLNDKDHRLCAAFGFTENNGSIKDYLVINSGASIKEIILNKVKVLGCGGYKTSAKLKDWLISRQRYWGTPIPIIYCDSCGIVPVPEEQLPVQLPEVKSLIAKGSSILRDSKDWYNCDCPSCGGAAVRETDTMDTFVDSSWYFLRYLDVHNNEEMFSKNKADCYMPVDLYIGGLEHALLHLYYTRFIQKFLKDQGLISHSEPFHKLLTIAVVRNKSYRVIETGKYLSSDDVDFSVFPPVEKCSRASLDIKYEKMSKSRYNGIEPQSVLDEFGVDATRFSILTKNEPTLHINWTDEDVSDCLKFLEKLNFYTTCVIQGRVNGLPNTPKITEEETKLREDFLRESRNKQVLHITWYYENCQFKHVRHHLEQLLNDIVSVGQIMQLNDEFERSLRAVILMMSPICPHFCAEIWESLNAVSSLSDIEVSIFEQSWPVVSPTYPVNIECQVNFTKVETLTLPFSEFSVLDNVTASDLAKHCSAVETVIGDSSILEAHFNLSEINASVNFITIPREDIFRELDCEIQDQIVCAIKIPQDEYVALTERKAADLCKQNEEFKNAVKDIFLRGSPKFQYMPSGRSKISYRIKKRKKDITNGVNNKIV